MTTNMYTVYLSTGNFFSVFDYIFYLAVYYEHFFHYFIIPNCNIEQVINYVALCLNKINYDFFNEVFSFFFFTFKNYPIFFFFGSLFFLTTFCSFFLLNQLGLYGVFISNFISLFGFYSSLLFYINDIFSNNLIFRINCGKWFLLNPSYNINFSFYIDQISFSFLLLTISIAFFVYIYSFSYFRYEPLVERLLLLLNSFVISMAILVTADNFIILFLGWELIGLTSFFLINFWVARIGTLKAGFKAYSFNKFSDFFLLFSIFIIYNLFYDLQICSFNLQIPVYLNFYVDFFFFKLNIIEVLSFLFLSSAFIKSAQIGPHIWLPDSMEAPVPASALIHSATLVSAGIFLILRLNPLFEYSIYFYYIVPLVGSITAAFGGVVAAFQSDVKRILAYSTISHCGFLMVLCSSFFSEYTIIYLYVHGFFKAAVFLCVGNVIRFSRNYQDFRHMGGYAKYLPFDCLATFICLINLSGLPFTLGFFIKHLIFLSTYFLNIFYLFILVNCIIGALSGLMYSYRLFFYVFFDFKKGKKVIYTTANRKNLNSIFYSNTSLASNIAIFGLIFNAYLLCFFLIFKLFNFNFEYSDFTNTIKLSSFYTANILTKNMLVNLSLFNWITIFFIISIVFSTWRETTNVATSYKNLFLLILFFVFYYILALFI